MIGSLIVPRQGSRRLARVLLWLTVAWNVIEGGVGVVAGALAGSVALLGFSLDSLIEITAALILLWRLAVPDDDASERREVVARKMVGATFIALSVYILFEAVYVVLTGNEPDASRIGVLLALSSLLVQPALGFGKLMNARALCSPALVAESKETLLCLYLSALLFLGLGANALFGWWWADVAAALAMVPWITKEGIEGLRGESCEDDG